MKQAFPNMRKPSQKVILARCIVIFLMLANLAFIWFNSSKIAKDSTKASHTISHQIASYTIDGYKELPKKEQTKKIKEDIDPKVRSAAHMIEYIPLGALIFLLIASLFDIKEALKSKKIIPLALLSVFMALIFATTDEVHQLFVKGRSFQLEDIGMDSLGMLLGYIVSVGGLYLFSLKKAKNTD